VLIRKSAFVALLIVLLLGLWTTGPALASIEVDEEEVVFRLEVAGAGKVFITGDFNNWNPKMDSMVKRGGVWEVRLYLVPGRYRYMFVVDGREIPDPDNPHRESDGRTYFIFREREGTYDIIYEAPADGAESVDEKYSPHGSFAAAAVDDYGLFSTSAGISGEIGEKLSGDFLVGLEYETAADDPLAAYLVRARGEYDAGKIKFGAFHRSAEIGFSDPLSIFTDIGPYNYPLGLFCRGAEASASWTDRAEARFIFANRIDGYLSGLETRTRPPVYSMLTDGNPEDRDMIALSIAGKAGSALLKYMFRHDRGPGGEEYGGEGWSVLDGYGTRTSHGFLVELSREGYPTLSAEYLTGRTDLRADSVYLLDPSEGLSDYTLAWEDGFRAYAGISYTLGDFSTLLDWRRTTIERDPGSTEDYSVARDRYGAAIRFGSEAVSVDLSIDLENFVEDEGTGRTFWQQRRSFWLDGDMLRTGLLQFLDSRRVWRAGLSVEEGGIEDISGPYRIEGYISAVARWNGDGESSMLEVAGGKGLRLGSYMSVHADMRYVTYSDDRWTGDNAFFDIWAGLRGSLGGSGWIALGVGVPPHRFDRWYHDFSGNGREAYLLDRDLFDLVDTSDEYLLLEKLAEAEKELSEEWRLSFEGGFSF
jgi:hypothetical protein